MLASEPRCMRPVDVHTQEAVCVPLSITLKQGQSSALQQPVAGKRRAPTPHEGTISDTCSCMRASWLLAGRVRASTAGATPPATPLQKRPPLNISMSGLQYLYMCRDARQ